MASTDPLIGKKLGDYIIESVLGTGGMARVYRGYDDKLDRYAAIKVIEPQLIASDEEEEYRERFLREARSIARLNHPNIVGVYQFNQFEDRYYIAMAYIEGSNLRDVLKQVNSSNRSIPRKQMLKLLRDIADSLDYAHQQGIIHRDVKPSNIIVTREGKAVLTDFGLALNAVEGTIGNTFGSVHYIAPEQAISSAQAVAQSDQYSLAIVAYEMLTGQVPFDDASAMSVALKHISDPPPPPTEINPDIPIDVERVLMRALDKDFSKRFDTCVAFVQNLESAFAVASGLDSSMTSDTQDTAPVDAPAVAPAAASPMQDDLPTLRDTSSRPSQARIDEALAKKQKAVSSTPAEKPKEKEPGGSRTGLLIGGFIVVLLLIAGGISLILIGGDDNAPATETALALAQNTPTETQTDEAADPTITPEPDEPTAIVIVEETEALTDTDTPVPTDTDTPQPAESPTPGFEMLDETDAQVLLRYDGRTLVLFNREQASNIDVSQLRFVKFVVDENGEAVEDASFRASDWDTNNIASLPPQDCLQVWVFSINNLPAGEPPSDMCDSRLRFRSTVDEFWIAETQTEAYFEVRRGAVDVLTTCPAALSGSFGEQRCLVTLP